MNTKITKDLTLKIKDAEILESQLAPDDLRMLKGQIQAGGGAGDVGVLCPGTYCSGGYSDQANMLEQVFNPTFLNKLSKSVPSIDK